MSTQVIIVVCWVIKYFKKSSFARAALKQERTKLKVKRGLVSIGKTRFGTTYWSGESVKCCLPPTTVEWSSTGQSSSDGHGEFEAEKHGIEGGFSGEHWYIFVGTVYRLAGQFVGSPKWGFTRLYHQLKRHQLVLANFRCLNVLSAKLSTITNWYLEHVTHSQQAHSARHWELYWKSDNLLGHRFEGINDTFR
jgi:hypothetical protein